MKRFFLFAVLLFSVFFLRPLIVDAQTPTLPLKITLPGTNCGVAEDPSKNQCCSYYRPDFNLTLPEGLSTALAPLIEPGLDILKKQTIQPFINFFSGANSPCYSGVASESNFSSPTCKCINPVPTTAESLTALNYFCQKQSTTVEAGKCLDCINKGGIWTGIGCVYTDVKDFIEKTIFRLGIGLAGGFALLCIIYAAFMMQSSQGNPEKLKKAQELITSCIMGLMLIIFSVFILRLIGVDIIRIPGFS